MSEVAYRRNVRARKFWDDDRTTKPVGNIFKKRFPKDEEEKDLFEHYQARMLDWETENVSYIQEYN